MFLTCCQAIGLLPSRVGRQRARVRAPFHRVADVKNLEPELGGGSDERQHGCIRVRSAGEARARQLDSGVNFAGVLGAGLQQNESLSFSRERMVFPSFIPSLSW